MTFPGKQEIIKYRIERAYESFDAAKILFEKNHNNECVNRLYYALFYAVSSLLLKDNLYSSKHSGIRSILNKNYIKENILPKHFGLLYNELYEYRQESDYKDLFKIKKTTIEPWFGQVKNFIDEIKSRL